MDESGWRWMKVNESGWKYLRCYMHLSIFCFEMFLLTPTTLVFILSRKYGPDRDLSFTTKLVVFLSLKAQIIELWVRNWSQPQSNVGQQWTIPPNSNQTNMVFWIVTIWRNSPGRIWCHIVIQFPQVLTRSPRGIS